MTEKSIKALDRARQRLDRDIKTRTKVLLLDGGAVAVVGGQAINAALQGNLGGALGSAIPAMVYGALRLPRDVQRLKQAQKERRKLP